MTGLPDSLVIAGRHGTMDVARALLSLGMKRTIDGASTLDMLLNDPDREYLTSDVIKGNGDGNLFAKTTLDGRAFRLVHLSVTPRRLGLQLEAEEIWKLRQHDNPHTWPRSRYTRAQVFKAMCDEAGVELFCPELNIVQKIAKAKDLQTPTQRDRQRRPGFADHVSLTVKGAAMSAHQRHEAATILDVAASLHAGLVATLASICAAIGESTLGDEPGTYQPNSAGYWGTFQGGSGQNGSARNFTDPRDTAAMAHYFFEGGKGFQAGGAIKLARAGVTDPGQIATAVEASGAPADFYGRYRHEAQAIIDAYSGGDSRAFTGGGQDVVDTFATQYVFQRGINGKREDSWTAMKRMASEVNWYLFESDGVIYFVSPDYLRRSRPRLLVSPDAPGIEPISFEYDTSPKVENTIPLTLRLGAYDVPTGTVVEVDGYGPIDGRDWVLAELTRSPWSATTVAATVQRIRRHRDEPAHVIRQRSSSDSVDASAGTTGQVTIASGANRAGVKIEQHVIDFLKLVAGLTSEPIVVVCGTNHNRYVLGTHNESDHWTGNAADIGVGGDARSSAAAGSRGDNIATAALRVLGVDEHTARQWAQSGALDFGVASTHQWHGYRVQVGWRTLVGGNHFNHVHIGVH